MVHVFVLLGDLFFQFRLYELLVPFASPYRPLWTALGVLGWYLLLLVTGSFYIRDWSGYRWWRVLHYLSFGIYGLTLSHGVLSGTDSATMWPQLIYWGSGLSELLLTVRRIC